MPPTPSVPAPQPALPRDVADALATLPDGEQLRDVWHHLPVDVPHVAPAAQHAAWSRLQARLHDPHRERYTDDAAAGLAIVPDDRVQASASRPDTSRGRSMATRRVLLAAASLVVAILGGATWRVAPVTHEVARGASPQVVRLGDGSEVTLAPGSRMEYPRALGWSTRLRTATRTVELEGEAFFSVQQDGRPFVVRTSDAVVQVLGTRFDVRTPVGALGSRVTVAEGRVAVRSATSSARAVLTAGMGVTVEKERLSPVRLPATQVGAWRDGGLTAVDEPLSLVLSELSRRYGVELVVDPSVPSGEHVSLFYPTVESLEAILDDLCTAEGLTWSRTTRGYRITPGTGTR